MYSALELSNYIIAKCARENYFINNLQLQKLLYNIQMEFLDRNTLAFPDEFQAWQVGPVLPNVYYEFCAHGSRPIFLPPNLENFELDMKPEEKSIVDYIVETRRELDPWDFMMYTQKEGGAWDVIFRDGTGNHQVIPISLIKNLDCATANNPLLNLTV